MKTAWWINLVAAAPFLLGVSSCSDPVEPEPTLHLGFVLVPAEHYSQDPGIFWAIQPRIEVDPPADFWWCLDVQNHRNFFCKDHKAGEIGGQRWYLRKDMEWEVKLRAIAGDKVDSLTFRWPFGPPDWVK